MYVVWLHACLLGQARHMQLTKQMFVFPVIVSLTFTTWVELPPITTLEQIHVDRRAAAAAEVAGEWPWQRRSPAKDVASPVMAHTTAAKLG